MMSVTRRLKCLEKALNYYLFLDPEINTTLKPLIGKVIALEGPRFCYYYAITSMGFCLEDNPPAVINVRIVASWFDYFQLAINKTGSAKITIHGNIESAQALRTLFSNHHIDWEIQLAQIVGDPVTNIATRLLRALNHWTYTARGNLGLDIVEYLQEETQIVPVIQELEDFFLEIQQLETQISQLSARIARLSHLRSLLPLP